VPVSAAPPPRAADTDDELNRLLTEEEREARRKVGERDLAETHRRRQEVRAAIEETLAGVREQARRLDHERLVLESLREQLDGAGDAPMTPAALHRLKVAIHQAHMETVRRALDDRPAAGAPGERGGDALLRAPVLKLTRLGLALSWPVLVAALICWLLSMALLMRVFGL